MDKIYGYKQEDIIALSKMITNRGSKPLQRVFEEFAKERSKAKGTVRNLYYALVRYAKTDEEFCNKYLNGKVPTVSKIEGFSVEDEKQLIDNINEGIRGGKSVRAIVLSLAEGDAKLALRYQNKYRTYLVKNPVAIRVNRANAQEKSFETKEKLPISNLLLDRLKKDINSLVDKISLKEKKENIVLRKRIAFLEAENLKLSRLVYGKNLESHLADFFTSPKGNSFTH